MSYKLKFYYLCYLTNINSLNINENVKKSLLCFGVPIGGFLAIYLITKTNETKPKIEREIENNIPKNKGNRNSFNNFNSNTSTPNTINSNSKTINTNTSNIDKKIEEIYEDNINLSSDDIKNINNINFNLIEKKLIELKNTEKTGLEKIDLEIKTIENISPSNLQSNIENEIIKINEKSRKEVEKEIENFIKKTSIKEFCLVVDFAKNLLEKKIKIF